MIDSDNQLVPISSVVTRRSILKTALPLACAFPGALNSLFGNTLPPEGAILMVTIAQGLDGKFLGLSGFGLPGERDAARLGLYELASLQMAIDDTVATCTAKAQSAIPIKLRFGVFLLTSLSRSRDVVDEAALALERSTLGIAWEDLRVVARMSLSETVGVSGDEIRLFPLGARILSVNSEVNQALRSSVLLKIAVPELSAWIPTRFQYYQRNQADVIAAYAKIVARCRKPPGHLQSSGSLRWRTVSQLDR